MRRTRRLVSGATPMWALRDRSIAARAKGAERAGGPWRPPDASQHGAGLYN